MKSSFSWLISHCNYFCPCIIFKRVLIYVVEPLLILIYSTKYIHRFISIDCCMPISSFDGSFSIINDFPLVFKYVVNQHVVESFISIPSSKDNHFMAFDDSWVSESLLDLWITLQWLHPCIFIYFIDVKIIKDVIVVSTSKNYKFVLISKERMVSPR